MGRVLTGPRLQGLGAVALTGGTYGLWGPWWALLALAGVLLVVGTLVEVGAQDGVS